MVDLEDKPVAQEKKPPREPVMSDEEIKLAFRGTGFLDPEDEIEKPFDWIDRIRAAKEKPDYVDQ